jgi:hypothetical protein
MNAASTQDVLRVAMDEFKALRDEINQRATYCHTLININVVGTGTFAGFVLANPGRTSLLLLLPLLNPVLGLLWLDHSFAIRNMGDYINTKLKPVIAEAVGDEPKLLQWESYLDEHERGHKLLRFLPLGVPILVLFTGVPTIALVRVWGTIGVNWKGVVWVLGLALTISFLALWLTLLFQPWARLRPFARRHG